MSEDHERQAEAAEREVAELEERSEQVGAQIDAARKDWEAKVADPSVPGAGGDPDRAEEGGKHPETAYPAKGSDDEVSEDDPAAEREDDSSDSSDSHSSDDSDDDGDATAGERRDSDDDGDAAGAGERASDEELPPPDPTETD